MWSSARSEAALEAGASGPDRNPPDAQRAAPAPALRRGERNAEADLPVAHQPQRGARLGARPARLDRSAACPRRARRAVRAGRDDPDRRAETCGSSGTETAPRTPRSGRRRAALRRPARRASRGGSSCSSSAARSTSCPREVAEFAAAAGVTATVGQRRRCRHALGQLLVARRDPAELAADPRAARRCAATSSRTRSRISCTSTTAPKFKALEARLFGPGLAEAKASLRRVGPRLRRIGRRAD